MWIIEDQDQKVEEEEITEDVTDQDQVAEVVTEMTEMTEEETIQRLEISEKEDALDVERKVTSRWTVPKAEVVEDLQIEGEETDPGLMIKILRETQEEVEVEPEEKKAAEVLHHQEEVEEEDIAQAEVQAREEEASVQEEMVTQTMNNKFERAFKKIN
jgi:hypothetical protein